MAKYIYRLHRHVRLVLVWVAVPKNRYEEIFHGLVSVSVSPARTRCGASHDGAPKGNQSEMAYLCLLLCCFLVRKRLVDRVVVVRLWRRIPTL